MNIVIFGAAGFIGTNLILKLAEDPNNFITAIDVDKKYFNNDLNLKNVVIKESLLDSNMDYDEFLINQHVVYHLVSTTVPTTSNKHITEELKSNILFSSNLFDACVRSRVKKVIYISSGGTVYGKNANCPINEDTLTNPITSYGVQKLTTENLLYLYNYMHGIDYSIIRLANPYGPYQRPNGILGAISTFTYKALKGEDIIVYGDGSVIRDFIYIDDVVKAIIKIANGNSIHKIFNLGSGYGTSILEVLRTIEKALDIHMNIIFQEGRSVDVPKNYLDISRYEDCYGRLNPICLEEGIKKTAEFMRKNYNI